MRTRNRSIVKALVFGIALITVLFIIFKIRAEAKSSFFDGARFACEEQARVSIRNILRDEGIRNPGINITSVTSDGKVYDYEVLIHLPSYIHLDSAVISELSESIRALSMLPEDRTEVIFS